MRYPNEGVTKSTLVRVFPDEGATKSTLMKYPKRVPLRADMHMSRAAYRAQLQVVTSVAS